MKLHQISRRELRRFGITLGIILSVIATIQLLKGHTRVYPWLYTGSALGFVLAIFIPDTLKPIYFVFTKIAHVIGTIITRLFLAVVFYVILTPVGLIAKLFGKSFLDINWKNKPTTYWIKKEQPMEGIERYERQF